MQKRIAMLSPLIPFNVLAMPENISSLAPYNWPSGLTVYFADPYSAWQRGANENTNGLLRRYFPQGMDFKNVTEKSLAEVVKKTESSTPQVPRLPDAS